ncbi:isocitrate dehydrogenase [Halomonas vilamensis]|uniref:Isocitrate dehydrogenase n=1 Tax=Vreelandella vilamensis TaxID=531309 RepID=A0ABU1H6L1_9GAMM|nr:isocitrate dehydrogenase [Halomonas vilamensis]MDR5899926.1 isocitrate dehydrogenase [Halomonas vilamensis]
MSQSIAVIKGDGIGPEIMDATLRVLDALDCGLEYQFIDAGLTALEKHGTLIPQESLDTIEKLGIALKGPLTTPIGKGFSSINVQLRRHFDLYANVRPAVSFPGTRSRYDDIDMITVRENTEGAYLSDGQEFIDDGNTGISVIKVTREGSERIVRYAFELAKNNGRKKVTAVHKANIIKTSSGLFLDVAREVAKEYPEIEFQEMIVDNACMQLVMNPHQFDVVVTTNLFGDIMSDLCAGLVGGLGLAPGANIGEKAAIFEAVHGSAPDIEGKKLANPCALLLAAAQMLDHLGMNEKGNAIRQGIRDVLERRRDMVTPDMGGTGSTDTFADALVEQVKAK